MHTAKWPKVLPPLTPEQRKISDDFMKLWHEVLPKRFGIVERFNHAYPVKASRPGFTTSLEIGAGLGEHLHYEKLTPEQEAKYYALELRENMAAEIRRNFPKVQAITGDCQARLAFADGYFDRVIAVHVLEHLPDLPAAIRESWRLLNPARGQFLVVIPTEGSPAYTLARKISAERVYKRRYGGDYSWFYKREHINMPGEIIEELERWFTIEARSFFPLPFLPMTFCNLCIGLSLRPRAAGAVPSVPAGA
jgi:SAM-dependent methyltransferase